MFLEKLDWQNDVLASTSQKGLFPKGDEVSHPDDKVFSHSSSHSAPVTTFIPP